MDVIVGTLGTLFFGYLSLHEFAMRCVWAIKRRATSIALVMLVLTIIFFCLASSFAFIAIDT